MTGLWQVDGTLPNLALMKLSAWLKENGHQTVLQGTPDERTRYASVIFTANRPHIEFWRNAYTFDVGGSGWDLTTVLPPEVEAMTPDYDLYGIDYAMGFLYRGCIRHCSFCFVPEKEGTLRRVAMLAELVRPDSGRLMLLDNNLTAAPDVCDVLGEMTDRNLDVCLTQGLDIRLMTPAIAAALAKVRTWSTNWTRRQLYFAFDSVGIESQVRAGIEMLLDAGVRADTLSFYVLVGYNTTLEQDVYRCDVLREYGVRPYVMRYHKSPELNALARWANSNAGMWRKPFSTYSLVGRRGPIVPNAQLRLEEGDVASE